jgi:CRISPR/Cas system-associated exonuclease Cas4 (RecB family)
VQVGLQSILLESSGYKVREAVIYYASEKLRLKVSLMSKSNKKRFLHWMRARECVQRTSSVASNQ